MPREARLFTSSAGSVVRGYPEIPCEYSATLDKKCAGFAQADRAGDCRKFSFSQTSADRETKGKSRDSERAAGIALGLGSLGDSLSQRELLSGDTNSLGVAARRLLHFVTPIPCLLAVLVYSFAHARHGVWQMGITGGANAMNTTEIRDQVCRRHGQSPEVLSRCRRSNVEV